VQQVPDYEWLESCAEQRTELIKKIEKLALAKKEILAVLGAESSEEDFLKRAEVVNFNVSRPGVVPGTCQYITGFSGNVLGLAIDHEGNAFVADQGDNSIKVVTGDGGNGAILRTFGHAHLAGPEGIALDKDGTVYVCNFNNNTISIFNHDGRYLRQITDASLSQPRGIAVDEDKNVYVANFNTHMVSVFDRFGALVRQIGSRSPLHIHNPMGIAVDSDGMTYVANSGSHSVSVFNSEGEFVRQLGSGCLGHGPGQLFYPWGVFANWDGEVYVVNQLSNNVSVFKRDGKFVRQIPVNRGLYVAQDGKGQILVTESASRRIVVIRT
jgi:DNA-binding beta-propeller fold protein YncE